MVRQWFALGIFRVLLRMHSNLILALLAIARLVEIDWKSTGVKCFSFEYERSKFMFISPAPNVTWKCVDGTEATKDGHSDIRAFHREEFTGHGICHDFAERSRRSFLKKGENYMK